ncbi:MAG: GrpB family protein [Raineya sp.]|jgi:GrpB-like predicted nucleotidyltransferase (UPF0157 family)|nr:GrpB family protein [Raineya sp.]
MLIQEYQSSWADDFQNIKNEILKALSHLTVTIEHVGSTAVPHLAAKPIIDIDIIFDKEIRFDDIKKGLEKLGYYHNGNQGIVDRDVFKRNNSVQNNVLDSITHHLYVCPIYSQELKRHLSFRDYLIKNEKDRTEYQNLKYQIAEEANQDRKLYAQLKEVKAKDFISDILKKALND